MIEERLEEFRAAYSIQALCRSILDENRGVVRVQKDRVAEANLVKIIGATITLSNQQGFHATTLRELARTSGMSMGGLYAYTSTTRFHC